MHCSFSRIIPLALLAALASCSQSSVKPADITVTPLETGVDFSCRAVSAVSDQVIWASGTGNTVLRSTDGGASWQCTTPADSLSLDFRCLYAWDTDNALVFSIASPALGLKTTDGGKTWKQVYYNSRKDIFLNSVHFSDAQNGVAVGDPMEGRYAVIRTQDGGETWSEASSPEGKGGMFAASNGCVQLLPSGKTVMVTGGAGSYVFIQDDADSEWTCSETPLATGDENHCDGCYGVLMLDDQHGWVAGGNYAKVDRRGNMAYTEDGGKTWSLCEEGLHGFASSVQAFPGQTTLLVASGSDGLSWSEDGGKTWTDITGKLPEGVKGYHALSAARQGENIYAAGAGGHVARISK